MKYILLSFLFFLSACSTKNYETTQTKIVIIKSPKIKFADIGYIRNNGSSIELEMFVAGYPVEKITVDYLICVRKGCTTKASFNEEYLHPSYPNNILERILLGREIYEGKFKIKTDDGFEQRIVSKDVDIKYRVNSKEVFFKDKQNKIIFKIKDTK